MKIKLHLLLWSMMLVLVCACGDDKNKDPEPEPVQTKTVIAYLIGDSNLNGVLYRNISAMEEGMKGVATPGSTLVVYWDGNVNSVFPSPTLFKYVVGDKGELSERTILATYDEQDSTSESVMLEVLTDVRAYCPADNFGLIFGAHGSAWLPAERSSRAMGGDNGYYINIPNLADVLSASRIYFDFIQMDVCLMSTVEVAYELRNVTDYLIVSATEVIDVGFPYTEIMPSLFQRENSESALVDVAKKFVAYYDAQDISRRWGTMSVLKTAEMNVLAAEMAAVVTIFAENASGFGVTGLQQYGRAALGHDNAVFDFEAFLCKFTDNNIPATLKQQLDKVVVYKGMVEGASLGSLTIDKNNYSGIGCYIYNASSNKNWNTYYKQLEWYKAAGIDKANW